MCYILVIQQTSVFPSKFIEAMAVRKCPRAMAFEHLFDAVVWA